MGEMGISGAPRGKLALGAPCGFLFSSYNTLHCDPAVPKRCWDRVETFFPPSPFALLGSAVRLASGFSHFSLLGATLCPA